MSIGEVISLSVLISAFFYSIMAIRFFIASKNTSSLVAQSEEPSSRRILVILPFRDEEKNLQSTLDGLIPEILSDIGCMLVLVNSASSDDGPELAQRILEESGLERREWRIINLEVPGKGVALNAGMSEYSAGDIVVMIDADAVISKNSLISMRQWLSNEEIGAVSAQESILPGKYMSEYKVRSNLLRSYESSIGSTPILEGSLLAWDPRRIGWESFDENSNADDSQVAFSAIRSGHRSIVDSKIKYFDGRKSDTRTFSKFVRRSQGINKQLIFNIDLLWKSKQRNFRTTMVSNILLHVIIPWCTLVFLIIPFPIFLWEIHFDNSSLLIASLSPSSIYFLSQFSSNGRALTIGSIATIIGQFRILLRRRSPHWVPGSG